MIVVYILSAAIFAAFANYFLRRNLEKGGTSNAFLSLYFLISLCFSILVTPELFQSKFSILMVSLGCICGFLNFVMMRLTARSLEIGPPGLTFTFQNASCVLPGLLLCLLFGSTFGFLLTPWLVAGFLLIVLGLYFSTRNYGKLKEKKNPNFRRWLLFVLILLLVQGIILSIFQWRVWLFACPVDSHWLIPWSCMPEEDIWFMPAFFAVPTVLQLIVFWKKEGRKFSSGEFRYGSFAGVLNGLAMLLLLLATKSEGVLNKGMLFPLFTVSVILFCNLWGMKLYKEQVNWTGILCCIAGVIIGLF